MTEQRIIFVTGKGGVGKSTVALALAQKLSKTEKVLLVELGLRSYFADLLGIPVKYTPSQYKNNLDIAIWSGSECLKEYARYLLKLESLYQLFFENKISRSLIDIAPALSELAILGKITSGIRKVGPPLNYDVIVVDCYATGHMLALLRAPRGMAEAIQFGPMAEQSKTMLSCIKNPKVSEYIIVTLPEELPTVEADELSHEIEKEVGLKSTMICNRVWPEQRIQNLRKLPDQNRSPSEEAFLMNLENLMVRQQGWVQYLKHRHPNTLLVPMTFQSVPNEIISEMESHLP